MLIIFLALAAAPATCAPVEVVLCRKDVPARFTAQLVQKTTANFGKAYKQACAAGMLKSRPLIPVNGANAGKLFLINAPSANVASIYPGEGRMVLEYSFVESDGKVSVPDAAELKEAIFCAVVGASDNEQEASGRCLPD